ncbi:Small ubiquitin-related modifier 2 [Glycine max]|nr:Small ubiquitin-related modifier 2 [Glycine max]
MHVALFNLVGEIIHLSPLCVQKKKNMATNGPLKRKSPPDDESVNLKIKLQDGRNLFFKVNRDMKLINVFKEFCDRQKLDYETLKFIYDGFNIKGKHTAKMLNMEDDAEIVAIRPQIGGGAAAL